MARTVWFLSVLALVVLCAQGRIDDDPPNGSDLKRTELQKARLELVKAEKLRVAAKKIGGAMVDKTIAMCATLENRIKKLELELEVLESSNKGVGVDKENSTPDISKSTNVEKNAPKTIAPEIEPTTVVTVPTRTDTPKMLNVIDTPNVDMLTPVKESLDKKETTEQVKGSTPPAAPFGELVDITTEAPPIADVLDKPPAMGSPDGVDYSKSNEVGETSVDSEEGGGMPLRNPKKNLRPSKVTNDADTADLISTPSDDVGKTKTAKERIADRLLKAQQMREQLRTEAQLQVTSAPGAPGPTQEIVTTKNLDEVLSDEDGFGFSSSFIGYIIFAVCIGGLGFVYRRTLIPLVVSGKGTTGQRGVYARVPVDISSKVAATPVVENA